MFRNVSVLLATLPAMMLAQQQADVPATPVIGLGNLAHAVDSRAEVWPEMTLEGLRLSAEAQP